MTLWGAMMVAALVLMGLASRRVGLRHRIGSAASADPRGAAARNYHVAKILLRKGFHLLGVLIMLPGLACAPTFLGTSLAVAAFALAAVEATRLLSFSALAGPVDRYMRPFTDTRDAGQVLTTHFSLLLGLAVPLWVTSALAEDILHRTAVLSLLPRSTRSGGMSGLLIRLVKKSGPVGALFSRLASLAPAAAGPAGSLGHVWRPNLEAFSGMVTLGVMDVAASLVGTTVRGPRLVSDSEKTVSGTTAGILAGVGVSTLLALWRARWLWEFLRLALSSAPAVAWSALLRKLVEAEGLWRGEVLPAVLACAGSGLIEALTDQIDNMIIPYYHWTILLAARSVFATGW